MNILIVVLLLGLTTPAVACGVTADGGLHHFLEPLLAFVPFVGAWLGVWWYNHKGHKH